MTKRDQWVKRKPEKLMILCSVMLAPLNRSPLGAVTNIIQEAKENANAYEEVAASLKRERLGWFNLFEYDVKEQAARDASKTSEEASITSVGSRNVRPIKKPLNLIFGTFNQKSMACLEKRKADDSGGAQDGS
ncbi:hypothetical protein Tco_1196488 [Tanacetum coccineum]